jgi:hypothetical protein
MANLVSCDDCQFGVRKYADGYAFRDWSGTYKGDVSLLPKVPDPEKFWTYLECDKNRKNLVCLNLTGKCSSFKAK